MIVETEKYLLYLNGDKIHMTKDLLQIYEL